MSVNAKYAFIKCHLIDSFKCKRFQLLTTGGTLTRFNWFLWSSVRPKLFCSSWYLVLAFCNFTCLVSKSSSFCGSDTFALLHGYGSELPILWTVLLIKKNKRSQRQHIEVYWLNRGCWLFSLIVLVRHPFKIFLILHQITKITFKSESYSTKRISSDTCFVAVIQNFLYSQFLHCFCLHRKTFLNIKLYTIFLKQNRK